jgi:hypothetical protein
MGWGDKMDIEDYIVCGSTFGGPLALLKDDRKVKSNTSSIGSDDLKSKISLYTSSGIKITDIDWDNKQIMGMGWSDREELIVVSGDGNVFIYDIQGKLVYNFLILDLMTSANVLECIFWGDGVVAITSDMQIFVAEAR